MASLLTCPARVFTMRWMNWCGAQNTSTLASLWLQLHAAQPVTTDSHTDSRQGQQKPQGVVSQWCRPAATGLPPACLP
jgi:hypothetical protein